MHVLCIIVTSCKATPQIDHTSKVLWSIWGVALHDVTITEHMYIMYGERLPYDSYLVLGLCIRFSQDRAFGDEARANEHDRTTQGLVHYYECCINSNTPI